MLGPDPRSATAAASAENLLLTSLGRRAAQDGARPAFAFLDRGETIVDDSTYGELYAAARVIAANLTAAGLAGRPVLLSLPQGLDFVRAFLGCLSAGVIAVPAPFPAERRSAARCTTIIGAVRPAAIVTLGPDAADHARLRCFTEAGAPESSLLDIERLKRGAAHDGEPPPPEAIAFIQYTSGSVSNPKGVVITHGNLSSNLAMIRDAFRLDSTKNIASWLPMHHDMGLIGCVLVPLSLGMRGALMTPFAFLQRPLRWLRAIERFGATVAGAPNFAYELCVRKITAAEAATVDLSRWELAFCGSEPIRQGTLRRFADRFAVSRFDPRAQLACYGMAEATLLVSSTLPGSGVHGVSPGKLAADGQAISCGLPNPGTHVVIQPIAADGGGGAAGEICVSGEHVSAGYWDREAAAMRPDPQRELIVDGRRYLRTGDAGEFIDGELYVVGRLSDMIIINGANIHAEDIEATVLELGEDGSLSAAAAFGVQVGEREELVLACELKRRAAPADPELLLKSLSRAVADAHGVLPMEIVLLASGGLERTGTGKIRRGATRASYLAGTLTGISLRAPVRRSGQAIS